VSSPTPGWFEHCPLFEVFVSSQCVCFPSLQIADLAHWLPKTWCSLLHLDFSWMHLKSAVWWGPCMVCGSSMQAARFQKPHVLIGAGESSCDLRKHYQLYFVAIDRQCAQMDQAQPPNVRLDLLQYVGPWCIIINQLSKMEKNRQWTSSQETCTSRNAPFRSL